MPNIIVNRRVVLRAPAALSPTPFSAKLNFRRTLGYATDGAGQTFATSTDAYPTTRNGLTFGWETAPFDAEDRDNSLDARLAGINYSFNTFMIFRLDIAAGARNIRLAIGQAGFPGDATSVDFIDSSSTLATLLGASTLSAHFLDANGTDFTAAAWPAGNVARSFTFSSTIFRLKVGLQSSGAACLAHLEVT